jgi:hypothetical protein
VSRLRLFVLALVLLPVVLAACAAVTGGTKKLIITEGGCQNLKLLRLKVGEETRIVLDDTKYNEQQDGMSLIMERFPMTVTGELPPLSTVGADFTSVTLRVNPGEKATVDVKAFATGQYTANCNIALVQSDSNQVVQTKIVFQIVE